MRAAAAVAAIAFFASVSIAAAQGHGGGHGGGGGGGGGGHASAGGHASGGHASSGSSGSHASGASRAAGSGSSGSTGGGSVSNAGAHRGGQVSTVRAGTGTGVPPYSRPRNGNPSVGTAVPRSTSPTTQVGVFVPAGSYYLPGLIGGYGLYGFGLYGLTSAYYDPWYGAGYGYGWGSPYVGDPGWDYGSSGTSSAWQSDEGALRLQVKPKDASVYVDGQLVGRVDDFDGMFQKLHLSPGVHRVEIRAEGYETLDVDVRIEPGRKTTYTGELKRLQ